MIIDAESVAEKKPKCASVYVCAHVQDNFACYLAKESKCACVGVGTSVTAFSRYTMLPEPRKNEYTSFITSKNEALSSKGSSREKEWSLPAV